MFYEETSIAPDSNKRAVRAVILEIISTVLFAAFVFTLIYGVFAAPPFNGRKKFENGVKRLL